MDYINDHNIDILGVTETWLSTSDKASSAEVTPPGYKIQHVARSSGRSGGVAIIYKEGFTSPKQNITKPETHKSVESSELLLSVGSKLIRITVVYRPPPSSKNKLTSTMNSLLNLMHISRAGRCVVAMTS